MIFTLSSLHPFDYPSKLRTREVPNSKLSGNKEFSIMKRTLFTALLALVTSGALADSITFTESFNQTYDCTRFEGETQCDVNSHNSATLNATLRIPGLGGHVFESTDSVELSLGSLSYSFTFEEAEDVISQNRAVFVVTALNDNDQEVVVGRLTLTRL